MEHCEKIDRIVDCFGGKQNISSIVQKNDKLYINVKDRGLIDFLQIKNFKLEYEEFNHSHFKIFINNISEGKNMALEYDKLAREIVALVGGKENINGLEHCITRLRFNLANNKVADKEALENLNGVITVKEIGGQFQVVIGNEVADVYDAIMKLIGIDNFKKAEKEKQKPTAIVLDFLSGVFMPSISILTASGILKGINILLDMFGILPATSGLGSLLAAVADAMFLFFPAIFGLNAFKKLGGNPYLGLVLGLALCYPAIQNVDLKILGFTINTSYQMSVLPIIILSLIAVPLEKALNKIMPSIVRAYMVPALVFMICMPLGFCIIGPVASQISTLLSVAFNTIYGFSPILSGILLGGLWQILVIFGLHQVVGMALVVDILSGNPSGIMGIINNTTFVQTGAVLAIWLKTKDKKLKDIAYPAFISGIFGITEPAIYGVTLTHGKQFLMTCIGGAIQGLAAAILQVKVFLLGAGGVFSIPMFIDPNNPQSSLINILIVILVALIAGFVLAFVTFKDENVSVADTKKEKDIILNSEELISPLTGKIISLDKVQDEVFAEGKLGRGIAIDPEEGVVVAPCDGIIQAVYPTLHAIGILSDNGAEVLIHLGIDTVNLKGEGFTSHIKQGDRIKKGQILITVDLDLIKQKGYSLVTPVIVTNTKEYSDILPLAKEKVKQNDKLLSLIAE